MTGTNFEKYNKEGNKPTMEGRRKIANFVLEFRETKGDHEHAKAMLQEICNEAKIEKHMFVGYILQNSFSFDEEGWIDIIRLLLDYFYG